jgi:hypothetical protein
MLSNDTIILIIRGEVKRMERVGGFDNLNNHCPLGREL